LSEKREEDCGEGDTIDAGMEGGGIWSEFKGKMVRE
jgi:hypothetical protein